VNCWNASAVRLEELHPEAISDIRISKRACPVEHLSNRRKHSLINQSQSFRPVIDFNSGGAIADHPTAPAIAAGN
jgi:hypothetical protein